jgi:TatD DNase family protein
MLIDAHAHYYIQDDFNITDLTKEAVVILTGMNPETNKQCLAVAKKDTTNRIKVTVGFHPCDVTSEELKDIALKEIEHIKTLDPKDFVAIAEIGLDYFHSKDEHIHALQKKVFIEYLKLAQKVKKPVVIHARNSVPDTLDCIEQVRAKNKFNQDVVLHCFEASEKNIDRAIAMDCYFTIPASVKRNEQFQRLVRKVPLRRMLTETDAPFQGPVKGEPAKPTDVRIALNYIAEEKKMDPQEVENIIFNNYLYVF